MKRNAIVRIVIFSLVIVILAAVLCAGLVFRHYGFRWFGRLFTGDTTTDSGNLSSSGSVNASQVDSLSIEWVAGSITVEPADTDTITFQETGATSAETQMVWEQSGSKLTIRFSQGDWNAFHFGFNADLSKDLVVQVPRKWNCRELNIDSVSARVRVLDLTLDEIELNNVSGVCTFENCGVGDISLDTVSGDIRFTGTLNTLECDAVSANCTVNVTNVPKRIDMDGVSGDLDITVPEDCGFTVSLDTASGDFSSDFATTIQNGNYVYGDGDCRINISGVSGDVTIRKAV